MKNGTLSSKPEELSKQTTEIDDQEIGSEDEDDARNAHLKEEILADDFFAAE